MKDIHQDRCRGASHTDTLRSTHSEKVPSNTHRSLDPSTCYPMTGSPHRHSISHTPPTTASTTSSPCHPVPTTAMLSTNTCHSQPLSQQEESEIIQHSSSELNNTNTASSSIEVR